ncbi:MAG: hypothetical protein ACTSYI_15380 [Promethearchaeota archaeon]
MNSSYTLYNEDTFDHWARWRIPEDSRRSDICYFQELGTDLTDPRLGRDLILMSDVSYNNIHR